MVPIFLEYLVHLHLSKYIYTSGGSRISRRWRPLERWRRQAIITARKRSLGQGNIFTPVCHSVHGGGLPQCMMGYHPPTRHPPRPGTPPGPGPPRTRHPPAQSMLGDTVNARAVRILLECNLVCHSLANFFRWKLREFQKLNKMKKIPKITRKY